MKIEIYGAGCPRCQQAHQTFINAAAALGTAVDIAYITDINLLAERGITRTPTIVVDGRPVLVGRGPTPNEAKEIIQGRYKPKTSRA